MSTVAHVLKTPFHDMGYLHPGGGGGGTPYQKGRGHLSENMRGLIFFSSKRYTLSPVISFRLNTLKSTTNPPGVDPKRYDENPRHFVWEFKIFLAVISRAI